MGNGFGPQGGRSNMIHFVYPNTKGKQFIGCGRFIVFVAGEQPEEHYEVADPEC